MKIKETKQIKYQNQKIPNEYFYSMTDWPTKDIDGVCFVSVVKKEPNYRLQQSVHWIRRDSLKKV
jgi:hypothetical protein